MKFVFQTAFLMLLSNAAMAQTQVLADSSLELTGGGGTYWSSTSTNFSSAICDNASCGTCGGPCTPHSGTYYAWFGGAGGTNEIGTLTQVFNVATAGTGTLNFYYMSPVVHGDNSDSTTVRLDGNLLWFATPSDSNTYKNGYTLVSVSAGPLSSGSHTLVFRGTETGADGTFNQLVDDVTLTVSGATGIESHMLDENIRILQNLASKEAIIQFDFSKTSNLSLYITDMKGQILFSQSLRNVRQDQLTFSTAMLPAGVYTVNFELDNAKPISKKLIVRD